MTEEFYKSKTGVFWNIEDCPIPDGVDPRKVYQNIKSALANQGYHGEVTIWAYCEMNTEELVFHYWLNGIMLKKEVSGEVDNMLVDILLWGLDNPAPSNFMVISKNISEETELLRLLQDLKSIDYNILVAQPEEAASAELLGTVSSVWLSTSLFGGGDPINHSGSSHSIQMKSKSKRKKHHGPNTGLFWNIEDCPIPDGLDPHTFLQNIKSALWNQGYHGEVSIWAYCEKNKSLDDFSLTDITLVPAGDQSARFKRMLHDILFWTLKNPITSNVMVITKNISKNFANVLAALRTRDYNVLLPHHHADKYVKSVWLWPSLSGGGNHIDQSGSPLKTMTKQSNKSKTGVFWNMVDCPIPDGVDPRKIYQNIKSALANQGYHGEVTIWAYCEKNKSLDDFSLTDITLVPTGDQSARFKKMLKDFLFWALQNPVHYPETTPNLMLISKISLNSDFVNVLQALKSRDYNVLLALPDAVAYISSVWLWPSLSVSGRGNRIDQSGSSHGVPNKEKKIQMKSNSERKKRRVTSEDSED